MSQLFSGKDNVPQRAKNIFVDKRGTILKPQKRQNIDILIVIATTYLLHREIEIVIPGLTGDLRTTVSFPVT